MAWSQHHQECLPTKEYLTLRTDITDLLVQAALQQQDLLHLRNANHIHPQTATVKFAQALNTSDLTPALQAKETALLLSMSEATIPTQEVQAAALT